MTLTVDDRELIATLEKAAYVADHVGLMLEADQYAALASDLRKAADRLQSLGDIVLGIPKALDKW